MAERGIRTVWIDSDSVGVLGTKVYRDDILIATVPIGTQIYNDPTAIVGVEYKYEVQAYTSSSESTDETLGVNIDYYEITEPVVNLMPIMTNFRVDDAVKNRILFDTPLGAVTGLTEVGFLVTGKGVQSVDDELNFITVDSDFNYWDNNSIKLSGGNGVVYDFTKEPITNNIVIAEGATSTFFVDGSVGSSGDGLTEGTAFKTLLEGFNAMPASNVGGGKLWVKAFDYGNQRIDMQTTYKNGTVTNPNVIEGYKATPGDINSMYYTYNINSTLDALDPAEMPLFDGGSRSSTQNFISFWDSSYWIVRNVQFTNYLKGMWGQTLTSIEVENCLGLGFGETTSNNGIGLAFNPNENDSHKVRIKDTIIINATLDSYLISGDNFLVDNCKAYCNEAASVNDNDATTDYYYQFNGNNGLVLNSLCYKDTPNGDGHAGHGFAFKSDGGAFTVENNLVKGCEAVNIRGSYQARHISCRYNDFKDSIARANVPNRKSHADYCYSAAIELFSGGSYNTFENITAYDLDAGVIFLSNAEEDSTVNIQNNALIKNCTFDKMKWFIYGENATTGTSAPYDNVIDHCTINDADYFSWITSRGGFAFGNNYMRSNIFNDVPLKDREVSSDGWDYNFCLYWDSWTIGTRANAINVDPDLIVADYTADDYMTPQATFASIDVPRKDGIYYDKNGNERQDPTTVGGVMSPSEVAVEPGLEIPTGIILREVGQPIEDYDFYVSATGTGDGLTSDTPMSFADSQTTINSMTAGQSIAYKGGDEFYGQLNIPSKDNITITSYGTGQSKIKGTKYVDSVTSWVSQGSNIWTADIGSDTAYNVPGFTMGRTPVYTKFAGYEANNHQVTSVINGLNEFISEDLIGEPDLVGATIHIKYPVYLSYAHTITEFDSGTGRVKFSPDKENGNVNDETYFFINNHINLLTSDGYWYYDANTISMYSASTPIGVEYSVIDGYGITVTGDGVAFDNIAIHGFYQRGIFLSGGTGSSVKNCTITYNYDEGIYATGGTGTEIIGNTITNSLNFGTNIYDSSAKYNYNILTDNGLDGDVTDKNLSYAVGVQIYGANSECKYNRVLNTGYNAITAGGGFSDYSYNFVQYYTLSLFDGGGIYLWASDYLDSRSNNSTVTKNIVESHPNYLSFGTAGIYLDHSIYNVDVLNNTTINSSQGVLCNNPKECNITGNNIYDFQGQGISLNKLTIPEHDETVGTVLSGNLLLSETVDRIAPLNVYSVYSDSDWFTSNNNYWYSMSLFSMSTIQDYGRLGLSEWQALHGQDLNSFENEVQWGEYGPDDTILSGTLINNGYFETNISGWTNWNTAGLRVERSDLPGTYYLQSTATSTYGKAIVDLNTSVTSGKVYRLQFEAKCNEFMAAGILINSSSGSLIERRYIDYPTDWVTITYYYTAMENDTSLKLEWEVEGSGKVLDLDNVEVFEVTPDTSLRSTCVYNDTEATADIALPTGTWQTLQGVNHTGAISLTAFSSEILIKQ